MSIKAVTWTLAAAINCCTGLVVTTDYNPELDSKSHKECAPSAIMQTRNGETQCPLPEKVGPAT